MLFLACARAKTRLAPANINYQLLQSTSQNGRIKKFYCPLPGVFPKGFPQRRILCEPKHSAGHRRDVILGDDKSRRTIDDLIDNSTYRGCDNRHAT